jgi:hypothetical protein
MTASLANENSDVFLQRAAECAFPDEAMEKAILTSNINWLGREGSNLRMEESKSAWLFSDFKAHLEKMLKTPLAISIAWQWFPNKEVAVAGRISLAKSEATGCARTDREGHGVDSTCEFDQHAVVRHPAEVARVRQVGGIDL